MVIARDHAFLYQPWRRIWRFRWRSGKPDPKVVAPHYQPWFQPLYEPASGEIESLLFTLQGSMGAAVIFYILGYMKGRQRDSERS